MHVGSDESSRRLQIGQAAECARLQFESRQSAKELPLRERSPADAAPHWSSRQSRPRKQSHFRKPAGSECHCGRMPFFNTFITTSPQRNAISSFCGSIAGTLLKPIGDSPMISMTVDMVFAVYCPPHAPAAGHATFSRSCNSSSVIFPAAFAPTASNTS